MEICWKWEPLPVKSSFKEVRKLTLKRCDISVTCWEMQSWNLLSITPGIESKEEATVSPCKSSHHGTPSGRGQTICYVSKKSWRCCRTTSLPSLPLTYAWDVHLLQSKCHPWRRRRIESSIDNILTCDLTNYWSELDNWPAFIQAVQWEVRSKWVVEVKLTWVLWIVVMVKSKMLKFMFLCFLKNTIGYQDKVEQLVLLGEMRYSIWGIRRAVKRIIRKFIKMFAIFREIDF